MCSPSAIGSRQASSTIWARCRGGNLLRAAQARLVQQEGLQPTPLITAAESPDSGPVALQPSGDRPDRLPGSDGENDTGMLDLVEGQPSALGHPLQDGPV